MDTDDLIAAELRDSQAAVLTIDPIRRRRQAAVMAALDAHWTKYRIAAELGVAAPTVDSIIETVRRERDKAARKDGAG
jgi:hypothetical protein